METYDLIVIGGGPGGYPAAIRAAQRGRRVALVERELLGGTCLNWGCIPTKTLIAGAEFLEQAQGADALGVRVESARADYAAMLAHRTAVVDKLRRGIGSLLKAGHITAMKGAASFEGPRRVAVRGADGHLARLGAERMLVATGSTSLVPAFLPRHPRVVDSRGFLGLERLPKRLLVLGGGYIGCELAALWARLGVPVTIVEQLDHVLLLLDEDVRRVVRRHMEKTLGIRILTGRTMEAVDADDSGVRARAGDEALEADVLLVAVGRKPVTDGLCLERAGLQTNETGHLPVDAFGQTAVAGIYAVGDVNGGPQLAHAATSQGLTAVANAFGERPERTETLVPGVIFTSPEVAVVGLTEQQAKRAGRAVRVGTFPFAALGRALAAGHAAGFAKWIADEETGQLLGAQVVGPHATDLIAEAAVAVRAELTAAEFGRTIHAHPTFSEVWMEAAHAVDGECIHAAPRRRP